MKKIKPGIILLVSSLLFVSLSISVWAEFDTPEAVTELNSSSHDISPFITPDGLTIYFTGYEDGEFLLYRATRQSLGASFGNRSSLTYLNDLTWKSKVGPSITEDGLILVYEVLHTYGSTGDTCHLKIAKRSSTSVPFTNSSTLWFSSPTDTTDDTYPYISPDGLTLLFGRDTASDVVHIYKSTRPNRQTAFGTPTELTELSTSTYGETYPYMTNDQLTLFYHMYEEPGGKGGTDIYKATRASMSDPFGNVTTVPELNTSDFDGWISMTADSWESIAENGMEAYFTIPSEGDYDIYRSKLKLPVCD